MKNNVLSWGGGGRNVLDEVHIANKVIDEVKTRKKYALFLRLILRKHMTQ